MLQQVPPNIARENMSGGVKAAYDDVKTRSFMAAQLILDDKPGTLDMMVESTYPTQSGPRPVFGEEIMALAGQLRHLSS